MSRSTLAKSRGEKGKTTSTTPAVAHEIIPGKYTDQDWNATVDQDDGDEFASDIVEEICSAALDIIYKNYIQRQLIPFTVLQAKDAILQIIEWQFLSRDEGEQNVEKDVGWEEDEEPEPAATDCWAQGSVPKTVATVRDVIHEEQTNDIMNIADNDKEYREPIEPTLTPALPEDSADREVHNVTNCTEDEQTTHRTSGKKKIHTEKKTADKKLNARKGKLIYLWQNNTTESLRETEMKMLTAEESLAVAASPDPHVLSMPASCHSMFKLQAGRPPGNRDVLFDEKGNVVSVTKMDPTKLPSHRVRTAYRIVDPAVEAAQARLEAMRTGRFVKGGARKLMAPQAPTSPRSAAVKSTTVTSRKFHAAGAQKRMVGSNSDNVAALSPHLIEAMDVAPGVVVREGDRVKKGPRQHTRKADLIAMATRNGLGPISARTLVPTVTVAELLDRQTPVVRPLVDCAPIPPIHKTLSGQ